MAVPNRWPDPLRPGCRCRIGVTNHAVRRVVERCRLPRGADIPHEIREAVAAGTRYGAQWGEDAFVLGPPGWAGGFVFAVARDQRGLTVKTVLGVAQATANVAALVRMPRTRREWRWLKRHRAERKARLDGEGE